MPHLDALIALIRSSPDLARVLQETKGAAPPSAFDPSW
jgi:hypothetical protein